LVVASAVASVVAVQVVAPVVRGGLLVVARAVVVGIVVARGVRTPRAVAIVPPGLRSTPRLKQPVAGEPKSGLQRLTASA
jgi:hypothetical protein